MYSNAVFCKHNEHYLPLHLVIIQNMKFVLNVLTVCTNTVMGMEQLSCASWLFAAF